MSNSYTPDLDLLQIWVENLRHAVRNSQLHQAEAIIDDLLSDLGGNAFSLPIRFVSAIRLDEGIKRKYQVNEDFPFAAQWTHWSHSGSPTAMGLYIVADGMGGHSNGQEASRLAVRTVVRFLWPRINAEPFDRSSRALQAVLMEAVEFANQTIYQANVTDMRKRNIPQEHWRSSMMGTTLTAVLIAGQEAVVANVGDSRTYLYRAGVGLRQISHDHSVVQQLLDDELITAEEAFVHEKRNQITRCLGQNPSVEVDTFPLLLRDRDRLLLCSDGVTDLVRDEALARILGEGEQSSNALESIAEALVNCALKAGGLDNIAAVVVQVEMQDVAAVETMIAPLRIVHRMAS